MIRGGRNGFIVSMDFSVFQKLEGQKTVLHVFIYLLPFSLTTKCYVVGCAGTLLRSDQEASKNPRTGLMTQSYSHFPPPEQAVNK